MKRFTKRRLVELLIGSSIILAGAVYFVGLDRLRQGWRDFTGDHLTRINLSDVDLGSHYHSPIPRGNVVLLKPSELKPLVDLYNHFIEVMPNRNRTTDPGTSLPTAYTTSFSLSKSTDSERFYGMYFYPSVPAVACFDKEHAFDMTQEDGRLLHNYLKSVYPDLYDTYYLW